MQRTWVIKIGSSLLTDHGVALNQAAIYKWCEQLKQLQARGVRVLLVSSGAVAAGVTQLGLPCRPRNIHQLQAAAAVGQVGLLAAYKHSMAPQTIAQILLDHDDFVRRDRYLNARSTLFALLDQGVLPIINENDTVATDEIRFGDNDGLAALVTNLVDAERLVILTDQEGLFDSDPKNNPDARLIDRAGATDSEIVAMAGGAGSTVGTGGMATKVAAAQIASNSASDTYIVSGHEPNVLIRLLAGVTIGTHLVAEGDSLTARKRWLRGQLHVKGVVSVDSGAVRALTNGASLLAVGVMAVSGEFLAGDLVSIKDEAGIEVARGLSNYSSIEAVKLKGSDTKSFRSLLEYDVAKEFVHRNNLVLPNHLV